MTEGKNQKLELDKLLELDGPVSLIITAQLRNVSSEDRFQPAGFPQMGHVIYDAPRTDGTVEKVCIVDSAASMANHLESVCLANGRDVDLHPDLQGLPFVVCVTDDDDKDSKNKRPVTSTLKEGHRLASDYFLDGHRIQKENGQEKIDETTFRENLRNSFKIKEIKKGKTYFIYPENWWDIYSTIFRYDPNSLIHGVLFAKEQIKINRMLTAHMEAYGAKRVSSSGVKFDQLGKTTSGQPIFSVDEEIANEIRATFIVDLALLRSYGRKECDESEKGLGDSQKRLLLELILWKIGRLLKQPFRFRSNCFLKCTKIEVMDETKSYEGSLPDFNIQNAIDKCDFEGERIINVYYPSDKLFKVGTDDESIEDGNEEDIQD